VIERLGDGLETVSRTDTDLQRLCTIPGIGPVTAGAVAAFTPDLGTFDSGRNFSAWSASCRDGDRHLVKLSASP
jgi:transposase